MAFNLYTKGPKKDIAHTVLDRPVLHPSVNCEFKIVHMEQLCKYLLARIHTWIFYEQF